MVGRPTKLTPELQTIFCKALEAGGTLTMACAHADITPSTLSAWRNRGEDGEEPFHAFSEAVKRAKQKAGLRWLAKMQQHADAKQDWRGYKALLGMHFPELRESQTVEVHGDIKTNGADVTQALIQQVIAAASTPDE